MMRMFQVFCDNCGKKLTKKEVECREKDLYQVKAKGKKKAILIDISLNDDLCMKCFQLLMEAGTKREVKR